MKHPFPAAICIYNRPELPTSVRTSYEKPNPSLYFPKLVYNTPGSPKKTKNKPPPAAKPQTSQYTKRGIGGEEYENNTTTDTAQASFQRKPSSKIRSQQKEEILPPQPLVSSQKGIDEKKRTHINIYSKKPSVRACLPGRVCPAALLRRDTTGRINGSRPQPCKTIRK